MNLAKLVAQLGARATRRPAHTVAQMESDRGQMALRWGDGAVTALQWGRQCATRAPKSAWRNSASTHAADMKGGGAAWHCANGVTGEARGSPNGRSMHEWNRQNGRGFAFSVSGAGSAAQRKAAEGEGGLESSRSTGGARCRCSPPLEGS